MFATGGNPEAARLAGLRTDRLIWGSLVASAMIAGFAGIIYGWKVGNYAQTVGPGYLFPAIAAVFFGASQLKGRPNVWGTFIALYALAWGVKGLQLTFTTTPDGSSRCSKASRCSPPCRWPATRERGGKNKQRKRPRSADDDGTARRRRRRHRTTRRVGGLSSSRDPSN